MVTLLLYLSPVYEPGPGVARDLCSNLFLSVPIFTPLLDRKEDPPVYSPGPGFVSFLASLNLVDLLKAEEVGLLDLAVLNPFVVS